MERFIIGLTGLKNKSYEFKFEVNSSFFEHFENEVIEKSDCEAVVHINKSETMLEVLFQITGEVTLTCDRSLEEFGFPVDISEKIFFKYGEAYDELSDEIIIIPHNQQKIDFSQFIFEFILLSIPVKKIHPKFKDEDKETEEEEEEGNMIYSTNKAEKEDAGQQKEDEDKEVDPRWENLKKIKFNN
ncbi:YceD family protein [Flexithrix dorotheae]|uniref:YceD family protein n=1 Tax=Flexithrix dorotheae TaxID=70993 RepID=UPI00036F2AFA|nr:DUF177 domain-containing protein [Flexithrix dorotheae]